ncbi:MAG: hypothetical protein RIQ81_301 [Pseudomonadota bacterium]
MTQELTPKTHSGETSPGILRSVAFTALAAGIILRCWYIVWGHPLGNYIYSDMAMHADKIKRLSKSWASMQELDFLNPVGYPLWSSLFYDDAIGWSGITAIQLVMSCVFPLMAADIAKRCYGEKSGYIALILASLHFHLIDYFAYILSEGPFMFFMTAGAWLFVRAADQASNEKAWQVYCHYLVSGLLLGVAGCMKVQIIIPLTLVMAAWLLIRKFRPEFLFPAWRGLRPLLLIPGFLVPVLPVSVWGSLMSTQGPFLVSSYGPMNFLMGHYRESKFVSFSTPKVQGGFGSPANYCRTMGPAVTLAIEPNDGKHLLSTSLDWIRREPVQAVASTLGNLRDIAWCPGAWPSIATRFKPITSFAEILFFLFIYLPALALAGSQVVRWLRDKRRIPYTWPWLATLAGIGLTVMIGVGEIRYRVPFDTAFIILAAVFYSSRKTLKSTVPRPVDDEDVTWKWLFACAGVLVFGLTWRSMILPGARRVFIDNTLPTPVEAWLRSIGFPALPIGQSSIPFETLAMSTAVPVLILYAAFNLGGRVLAIAALSFAAFHFHLIEVFRFDGIAGIVLVANLVAFCLLSTPSPDVLSAGLVSGTVFLINPVAGIATILAACLARIGGLKRYLFGFAVPWLIVSAMVSIHEKRISMAPGYLAPRFLMTLNWDKTNFSWKDVDGKISWFRNHYSVVKSESNSRQFDHPLGDTAANISAIAGEIKEHPANLLTTPVMNARNMFWGQYLWPTSTTLRRHWLRIWEFLFHVIFVVPTVLSVVGILAGARNWKERLALPKGDLPLAFVSGAIITGALFGGGITHRVMFEFAFIIAGLRVWIQAFRPRSVDRETIQE